MGKEKFNHDKLPRDSDNLKIEMHYFKNTDLSQMNRRDGFTG